MDIKTLIVKGSTELFEKRCKEYLEKGYKLQTSTIALGNPQEKIPSSYIGESTYTTIFYYYAMFIKE